MKNKIFSFKYILIALGTIFCVNSYTCRITLSNDTQNKVSILDLNSDEMVLIKPNSTKTFGNPDLHAHFKMFIKSDETRTMKLAGIYQQTTCGQNMFFKVTELLNKTERVTSFFEIHEPGMVKTEVMPHNHNHNHHEMMEHPHMHESEEMSEIF